MTSIIALYAGFVGMFGLWGLAWRLWSRASEATLPGLELQYEPTVVRQPPSPSPAPSVSALRLQTAAKETVQSGQSGQSNGAPVLRDHPSSDANTAFFSRSAVDRAVESGVDKTEILCDDDIQIFTARY
jgi:hypothetical protein